MQSKLATWSTENKERKFDRLLRLIVMPTLPLPSATLERRAGCAERGMSGSGRRGREIVRLRPVSYSTPHGARLHLPGRGGGLVRAPRSCLEVIDHDGNFLLHRGAR